MFVGHYAPAAALKPLSPKVPLWHLFIAVQFLDYLWAAFILTGIEKARVAPGFLAASDLDLYFMPYTHSLAAALLWAFLGAALYRKVLNRRAGMAGAALIFIAIFSHWIADLLVHAPDLALYPGSDVRLGLRLWSSLAGSQILEGGLLAAGLFLYWQGTEAKGVMGHVSLILLTAVFLLLQIYNIGAPTPPDIQSVAKSALAAYTLFALLALFADVTRRPRAA